MPRRSFVSLSLCCLGILLDNQYHKLASFIKSSVTEPFCEMYPSSTCESGSWSDLKIEDYVPEQDSFSACLLVMDDNHRLVEWVAYHYYALNLRHLIVASDPLSTEDPSLVLDRWKDKIKIELWTDEDYLGSKKLVRAEKPQNISSEMEKKLKNRDISMHRVRQPSFYKRCAASLQEQNRTWTGLFDNDEYLALNSEIMNNTDDLVSKPNHLYSFLTTLARATASVNDTALLGYHFAKPCIMLPRINYGNLESSDEEIQKDVPSYLDPSRFDTLRWRYRSARAKDAILGKAIVDVSNIPEAQLRLDSFGNAHRPFEICKSTDVFLRHILPLGIHHYLGSWEQYMYRKHDARYGTEARSKPKWLQRGSKNYGEWDETRLWIQGFLHLFGDDKETVVRLLDGAGLPSNRSLALR